MKKFAGVDYMGLDSLLTEEELAVRQAVRENPTHHCLLSKPVSNDVLVETVRSRLTE